MSFFNNLSKKATETYKTTAEKTNKLTREMKLKSLMNEDKNKIERIYTEIGKKVYEKHVREENIDIKSELVEECERIDMYADEIEKMRLEILELKGISVCEKCACEISKEVNFCPNCGAVQEHKETEKIDDKNDKKADTNYFDTNNNNENNNGNCEENGNSVENNNGIEEQTITDNIQNLNSEGTVENNSINEENKEA